MVPLSASESPKSVCQSPMILARRPNTNEVATRATKQAQNNFLVSFSSIVKQQFAKSEFWGRNHKFQCRNTLNSVRMLAPFPPYRATGHPQLRLLRQHHSEPIFKMGCESFLPKHGAGLSLMMAGFGTDAMAKKSATGTSLDGPINPEHSELVSPRNSARSLLQHQCETAVFMNTNTSVSKSNFNTISVQANIIKENRSIWRFANALESCLATTSTE